MIIKKGCDCSWCEAVSWDIVGELRDTIEKLQQSLMMRGTCVCAPARSCVFVCSIGCSSVVRSVSVPNTSVPNRAPSRNEWSFVLIVTHCPAEVDRAELEALLQVKIEVSTDLREKLRAATEDIQDLRTQIHEQQEKIAHLDLVCSPPPPQQTCRVAGASCC